MFINVSLGRYHVKLSSVKQLYRQPTTFFIGKNSQPIEGQALQSELWLHFHFPQRQMNDHEARDVRSVL